MVGKSKTAKYVFLVPSIVWILSLVIYPLLDSLSLSFYRYQLGMGRQEFVWLKNYYDIFTSSAYWFTFRITIYYVVITVIIETLLGLFLAWLVNKRLNFQGFFRTLFTLPIFTTTVAVGYVGATIFHGTGGLANWLFGFVGLQFRWLSSSWGAFISSVLLDIWRWTPFAFIILLAGFQGVPKQQYEAAYLETKSDWKVFWNVELPALKFSLILVLLFRMVRAFKVFGLPFALTGGGPGRSTVFYTLYTYRTAINYFDFGHGSAMAYVLLVVVMVCIFQLLRILRANL